MAKEKTFDNVLHVENLVKTYLNKQKPAVENVSFTINAGEIVGLLGHNGAGKSTTIKCITGVLPYEGGKITICGKDNKKHSFDAKAQIGYVTDNHAVFQRMTGYEYLMFMADIFGVSKEDRKSRYEELENVFKLKDDVYKEINTYSHGMKQKICMMGSLIHYPKVWILDEPMIGLDPTIFNNVFKYMKEYASRGNAILFSSHNIDAVKRLCDRVIIIKKGKLAADLKVQEDIIDKDFDLEHFFLDDSTIEKEEK